jgi:osmoprotectant transport system substrate-binding protein
MTTSRWKALLALLLTFGLAAALTACGDDDDDAADTGDGDTTEAVDGPTIRIAPQDFAEAKTLTEVYGQFLEARGFDVEIQAPNGFRTEVYPDLEADELDMIIDYSGSAARFNAPEAEVSADPATTYESLLAALEPKGLVAFDHSPAEDKNALVALKAWAEENDITTISDLASLGGTIKLGAVEDCRERPDCLVGYTNPDVYGLSMEMTALEYGPTLTEALSAGEVQVAQYQTTAPEIASGDFVVLEDDKGLLSADNIVPVLRADLAAEYGDELRDAIDELSALLTTEDLIAWNVRTDIDKDEPADVAEDWLEEKGLL